MNWHRQLHIFIPGCLLGLFLVLAIAWPKPAIWLSSPRRQALSELSGGLAQAQTIPLASQVGWLEVKRLQGEVSITASEARPARVGDRLTRSGDRLTTGPRSLSILQLDNNIGSLQVAQNSSLSIRQLGMTQEGGWLTMLNLDQGQVRFRVNKEQMPRNSRFEVYSPSGVAGVRGTEFGVMVNPLNRVVIGTETGLVEAEANSQQVELPAGSGSAIFPGEAPTAPLPLDRQLSLDLEEVDYRGDDEIWLSGKVYPLNTVFANGIELPVSKTGFFEQQLSYRPTASTTTLTITPTAALVIRVENALGDKQEYELRGLGQNLISGQERP